jgi:hypothetical protein
MEKGEKEKLRCTFKKRYFFDANEIAIIELRECSFSELSNAKIEFFVN